MKILIILLCIIFLSSGYLVFAETPGSKTKIGENLQSQWKAMKSTCVGTTKPPKNQQSEKENIEKEKQSPQELTKYLYWTCSKQPELEKPFNDLKIPAPPPKPTLEDIRSGKDFETKISHVAGFTLNKKCSCDLSYDDKQKRGYITCDCKEMEK